MGRAGATVVGLDVGTTNAKLALVDVDAGRVEVRAVSTRPTPEPAELNSTLRQMLRQTLAGTSPAAVGIASMAETGVPLDRDARPLSGWLRWDRGAAAAEADALARGLGRDNLIAATGVRPSGKVPLAKWAWLHAHEPGTAAAMAAWAGVADYACRLLTGRLVTDHTLAGRTMAYRLRDPLPTSFDADLLAEVGLRAEQLPAVAAPDEIAGRTTADFVDCGLAAGTPVVVAGHDHQVGAYAVGVRQPGAVADSLGTAEAILAVVPSAFYPVAVGAAGMSSVVTVSGQRAIMAGSSAAGAVVRHWLDHEASGCDPDELFRAVLERDSRPSDLIVLPYLAGRQTPAPDPKARLRVLGRRADLVERTYALFEGLSLHVRWMLTEVARLAGTDLAQQAVTVFGAPATGIPAWTRIKARVLPCDVNVVSAAEPVAVGAAILAAERAGLIDQSPALPSQPETAPRGAYDDLFTRFVAAATKPEADTA